MQRKILRAGTAAIVFALGLRLLASTGSFWSAVVFLQTGRLVTLPEIQQTESPTEPAETYPEPVVAPLTADNIALDNTSGYSLSMDQLLSAPLPWQGKPAVLILHTHGTESYTQTETYRETSLYRTDDTGYNVVSIGDRLAQLLEAQGFRVIHDRSMHDLPAYDDAYHTARTAIEAALAADPDICLVLDLHRDATSGSTPVSKTVSTGRGQAAQLMFVLGTDAGGYDHPNWRNNLSVAVKLQARLEALYPGICRPIQLRTSRYNQDLSPGALLVEVGFTGNTRQEALLSAEILSEALCQMLA